MSRAIQTKPRNYTRQVTASCWCRKPFLAFVAAFLCLGVAPLQSQPQAPPISVDVKMVSMLASVRDKHGQLISTLTKDDFTVEQDGHAQTITYFAKESDLPLTLGLLVDTSGSQRRGPGAGGGPRPTPLPHT